LKRDNTLPKLGSVAVGGYSPNESLLDDEIRRVADVGYHKYHH